MKELFIIVHEELATEYLETHPNATEQEAYERTADAAFEGMKDRIADMIDAARDRAKHRDIR